MKIYLVGGAVRDKMLSFPVKEKDWVVVGATAADMLKQGFRSVGKDFPVFLHPETNEEYALARTERKIGRGYTGFDFNTSADVTLEEDLKRRDLTINAMAEDADGNLIDPYGGVSDLKEKKLRHVSSAFAEDPVRILRVARFAARYAQYGFTVASETIDLMKTMVASGEVDALVPERVWKELERALGEKNPEQFFLVLLACDALPKLFPELVIKGSHTVNVTPDAAKLTTLMHAHTPIKDKFVGENVLIKAARTTDDKQIRFAVLLHTLAESEIKKICERYRVPTDYRKILTTLLRLNRRQAPKKKLSHPQKSKWLRTY